MKIIIIALDIATRDKYIQLELDVIEQNANMICLWFLGFDLGEVDGQIGRSWVLLV